MDATEKSSSPDPLSRKEARATESDGEVTPRGGRRGATRRALRGGAFKPGSNTRADPARNPHTSPSSVVALPNERTNETPDARSPLPRPDAQVPEGAEDSLDALQHASERLEADATALRREILHGALRVLASNDEADDAADREKRDAAEVATVAALADLAPPRSPEDPPDETPDDDHMTTFGRVASPGRETRREDEDIAKRAATLEAESIRLRTLTVAADVAEAFARAEASIHEAEAALARGEYEIAAAHVAATRDALRDASPGGDSPGGGGDSSVIGEIRAADREAAVGAAIASIDAAIRRDLAASLHASFALVGDTNRRTVESIDRSELPKELALRWTTLSSIDVCGKAGRDEAAAVARRAGESWGATWRERAAHDDARVLAEGLERSIDAIRDAWGELPEKQRALVAKTFGEGAWPPVANAVIRRWFSTDNSGSSRRHLDDDEDDDGVRVGSNETGLHETRLDEERVNALVGAEGAAQALGLVPPPPHVGPVESAAYERDRAERAGYVAAVLAAARDAIVGNPHETMRALGRSGDGDGAAGDEMSAPGDGDGAGDEKSAAGDGDGAGSGWRPGTGGAGAGFGDEIAVCAVCVEEGADFLYGEWCTVSSAAHSVAALAHRTLRGDGKSAPGDASTAFAAARDSLDLFRALRDPENSAASNSPPSPAAVCVYRNDCRYLAARWGGSTHHLCSGSNSEDGPRTRRLVSLSLAAVAVLHASGDAAVTGMLARCKADVFHALDDANGFRDLGEDGASREALNAVRRARHALGRVCGAVSRLLPRRLGARLARELLAAYAEKVAAAALALSDVSVDESDSLRGILVEAFDPRGLLVALPGTLVHGGGRAAADAEACALVDGLEGDAWMKGSFLPSMLDARLTDLAQWWDEGRLPALGFDVAEVAGFVRANFEASENRAAVLERLGER